MPKTLQTILYFSILRHASTTLSIAQTLRHFLAITTSLGFSWRFSTLETPNSPDLMLLILSLFNCTISLVEIALPPMSRAIKKYFVERSSFHFLHDKEIQTLDIHLATNSKMTPLHDGTFSLSPPTQKSSYVFANSEPLGQISGLINAVTYSTRNPKHNIWQDTSDNKAKRNISHIEKYSKCILLIRDEDKKQNTPDDMDNYLGFTHCIPVTEHTWQRYISGKISDNDFSSSNVYSADTNDKPYGIILFSLAMIDAKTRSSDSISKVDFTPTKIRALGQATAFHLRTIMDDLFVGKTQVPFLFQTERQYCSNLADKLMMTRNTNPSSDGVSIHLGYLRRK